jgi:hypothetical protein
VRRRLVILAVLTSGCAPVTTTVPSVSTTPALSLTTTTAVATTAAPTTSTTVAPLQTLAYTEIATGLPFPTFLTARAGEAVSYLTTKDGQVHSITSEGMSPVLDITDRVRNSGEQGLLGMALNPSDPSRVFLHYSAPDGDTVLAEYRFDQGVIDPASEEVLLRLDQPAPNHNGGMIAFGPDGALYLGLGDGGGGGDTFGTGQTTDDLFASLVRFDVDGAGEPEVWAIGLRNPWRFDIDGELVYIADVGQNAFEEIDVAPIVEKGLNYGWPITEGLHCFDPPQGCDTDGLTLPLVEISHDDAGTCSVTGGVVYRGPALPELDGHYFYSDYCGGWLRSFRYVEGTVTDQRDWTGDVGVPGRVTSFGVDGAGEMYVLTTDAVYRVDPVR